MCAASSNADHPETVTKQLPKDQFLESLSRCQQNELFLRKFYERFMDTSPAIRRLFHKTDFDNQVRMLAESLRLCAEATAGDQQGLAELNERARTHDRRHYNIKPEWYTLWLDSLVESAAEFDPFWSTELEAVWRRILWHVIRHMQARY